MNVMIASFLINIDMSSYKLNISDASHRIKLSPDGASLVQATLAGGGHQEESRGQSFCDRQSHHWFAGVAMNGEHETN